MNTTTYESATSKPSIFVFAGEQSGDNHAAPIIAELKRLNQDIEIWGVGGPELQKAGAELLYDCRAFAVIGFHQVVRNLAFFRKLIAEMVLLIKQRKPTLLFLVDCGGVNLRIARALRKSMPGLLIYQFISPQVWASRPWRVTTIKDNIDKVLVILPFEERILQNKGVLSKFVGHPLLRHRANIETKDAFCSLVGLNVQKPIIGLFPGSRKQEIEQMLPVFLKAACLLLKTNKDMQFVISVANTLLERAIESGVSKAKASLIRGENLFIVPSFRNHELMSHCDIAWAKSGTTTLEISLFGKPMLVCYKGSLLDYVLVSLFKTTRLIGLPHILAGYELVPELLQGDCNPALIARMTKNIFDKPSVYAKISEKLLELASKLGSRDYVCECVEEIQTSLVEATRLESGIRASGSPCRPFQANLH